MNKIPIKLNTNPVNIASFKLSLYVISCKNCSTTKYETIFITKNIDDVFMFSLYVPTKYAVNVG